MFVCISPEKNQYIIIYNIALNVYFTGETVSVSAKISNVSPRNMRPKFRLQQNVKYQAGSSSTASEKCLCKVVGDTMQGNSEASVSCKIMIPVDVTPTIRNCEIILVEYYLKVCNNNNYITSTLVCLLVSELLYCPKGKFIFTDLYMHTFQTSHNISTFKTSDIHGSCTFTLLH